MENYHLLILETIESNIRRFPNKTAYTIGKEQVSFAQMDRMANSIASYVVKNLKTDALESDRPIRIGISLPRSTHFMPCILAAIKLGCAYVPIDVAAPQMRQQFICEDAQADVVITQDNLDEILSTPIADSQPCLHKSFSEAYLIYTSGTTGKPKGVSIPYSALYYFLQTLSMPHIYNISENSIVLQFASINFDLSILELFPMLYCGSTMIIAQEEDRHDPRRLHDLIVREHITFCALTPTYMLMFPDFNFPELDTLVTGGEAVTHGLTAMIGKNHSFRFVNAYGPTESCVFMLNHEIVDEDDWQNIGKPNPEVVCYVADEHGRLVKPGETGELLIGGRQLANCYWNRPERNAAAFFENPYEKEHNGIDVSRLYHSGDHVIPNEDGSYNFVGRMDSQIKLNGYRIELAEIITRIEMHNRTARALVRVEEINNNNVLVAYVCTKDKRDYLTDIKEYVAKYLPAYMIPTFWNHVEEFTLNLNGKIDKSQLSNAAGELVTNTTPLTSDEDTLMREVASVLGLKEVNVEADLLEDFGLTSLQLMSIAADLTTVGFYVQAQDMARFRTIRNILQNTNSPDHYWYNDDDSTTKPVIICLSGFVGFNYMYTQMMSRLTDRFSIYVVEAYQPIIGPDKYATYDELMDLYIQRVKHVVDNHNIVAFTGVCYGGEHALYLAHRLYHDKPYKPAVVVLDGEVDRDIKPENNPVTYFPFFSEELNKHRTEQDYRLVSTIPDFVYQGKVISTISSEFIDCYSYLDPNPSEYKVDCMKAALASAPARWKHRYPDCEIIMYPANHDTFWRSEPSLTMTADCFNRIYDEQKNNINNKK